MSILIKQQLSTSLSKLTSPIVSENKVKGRKPLTINSMLRVRVKSESGLNWATVNTGTCNIIYEKEHNIQPSCITIRCHLRVCLTTHHKSNQVKALVT